MRIHMGIFNRQGGSWPHTTSSWPGVSQQCAGFLKLFVPTPQLCFIEKKAAKHVRRHKRRKHSIPWEKIKIIGEWEEKRGHTPAHVT